MLSIWVVENVRTKGQIQNVTRKSIVTKPRKKWNTRSLKNEFRKQIGGSLNGASSGIGADTDILFTQHRDSVDVTVLNQTELNTVAEKHF